MNKLYANAYLQGKQNIIIFCNSLWGVLELTNKKILKMFDFIKSADKIATET